MYAGTEVKTQQAYKTITTTTNSFVSSKRLILVLHLHSPVCIWESFIWNQCVENPLPGEGLVINICTLQQGFVRLWGDWWEQPLAWIKNMDIFERNRVLEMFP